MEEETPPWAADPKSARNRRKHVVTADSIYEYIRSIFRKQLGNKKRGS